MNLVQPANDLWFSDRGDVVRKDKTIGSSRWNRVATLDMARYPPLFSSDSEYEAVASDRYSQKTTQTTAGMESDRARVASLEKDILFLQQTHKTTLEKLHKEIEHLKRANTELQYQLIMGSHNLSTDSSTGGSLEKQSQTGPISSEEKPGTTTRGAEHSVGIITSLHPLKIHDDPARPPRTPTLQECEAIIQPLYNAYVMQSQELLRVKTILRNSALNKKKLSTEMYSLSKANLSDTTSNREFSSFPRLSQKSLPKIQQPTQMNGREKVVLPAIKRTLFSLTERQKRAQDIHKARLRRAVF